MASTSVSSLAELQELVGKPLGESPWHEVTQEQVNRFADATLDHQWIHVDVQRAKEGPFGGTIAHGYLTLSLAPYLLGQVFQLGGVRMGVNYGLNKVRFTSPVPVGSRVRLVASLQNVEEIAGGAQYTVGMTFEVAGQEKPACVAEAIFRAYE